MIYDFVCTPPEEYGKDLDDDYHTTFMEFPSYTYTGKLVSPYFCLGGCVQLFDSKVRAAMFQQTRLIDLDRCAVT